MGNYTAPFTGHDHLEEAACLLEETKNQSGEVISDDPGHVANTLAAAQVHALIAQARRD